jgi:Fur family peroxide stress response transcriptional regulator
MSQIVIPRETRYSKQITTLIAKLGHATNAEILKDLRSIYPDISATTVHRSSARLADRGVIALAPPDIHGSMRYDANIEPHDHFVCTNCGGIRDIDVAEKLTPEISKALGGCKITGRLLIHGSCETCLSKKEGK